MAHLRLGFGVIIQLSGLWFGDSLPVMRMLYLCEESHLRTKDTLLMHGRRPHYCIQYASAHGVIYVKCMLNSSMACALHVHGLCLAVA